MLGNLSIQHSVRCSFFHTLSQHHETTSLCPERKDFIKGETSLTEAETQGGASCRDL